MFECGCVLQCPVLHSLIIVVLDLHPADVLEVISGYYNNINVSDVLYIYSSLLS